MKLSLKRVCFYVAVAQNSFSSINQYTSPSFFIFYSTLILTPLISYLPCSCFRKWLLPQTNRIWTWRAPRKICSNWPWKANGIAWLNSIRKIQWPSRTSSPGQETQHYTLLSPMAKKTKSKNLWNIFPLDQKEKRF